MSSPMTENMQCAICQDTYKEPVTALCGAHNYCKDCLSAHISACNDRYQQPTCPTCRLPIQTNVSQLHVNIALRDAAAMASVVTVVPEPLVQKQPPPPIAIKATRMTDKLHIQLSVPEIADATMSTLFIDVIDISGSMGNSSVDTTQKSSDAAAFSRADLVRHAVATQIELLRREDELALVLFDNNATIALEPTQMTAIGRGQAKACLPKIRPTGGTSIWSGLQKALTLAAKPAHANKNIVIILQTDGESDPSYNPPRGIPDTFRSWRDAHPEVKLTVHTVGYGFWAALDMPLLRVLAEIGGGTPNYIPDGSMVGTVFIHLMANLMTCLYRGVKLHVPSHGLCIPVGFLQGAQPRDFVLSIPADEEVGEITVTADNVDARFTSTEIGASEICTWPLIHEQLVAELQKALDAAESGTLPYPLTDLVAACRAASADASVRAVLTDLADLSTYKGQVGKAFASAQAFQRWGRHYVPGVLSGHRNQWPINFKDEGSKIYGATSGLTRRMIDRGDEIFNSLPPPTASCAPQQSGYGGYGGYGGASSYVAPATMASINTAHGGCFLGASRVLMVDGTEKRCDEIQPGDQDAAGYVFAKVIKMHVPYADIVRLSGPLRPDDAPPAEGGFTPWHPVFPNRTIYPSNTELGWVHPADIGKIERVQTDAVYNFVLEFSKADRTSYPNAVAAGRPGILIVDGLMACTLGHVMQGPVITHSYFGQKEAGKRNILEDLEGLPGWDSGYITIQNGRFHNDPVTGMICGLTAT